MSIPRIVIVAYRPRPGKGDVLLAEIRDHHPFLRSEGLATDRAPVIMRSADGTVIEIFEWASPAAMQEAHASTRVQAMWARFAQVCDYVPVASVPEAGSLFSEFEPLEIDFPAPPQPDPAHREE